jgi:inner membrane protein
MRCYDVFVASIGHVAVGLLVGRACEAKTTKEKIITMSLFGGLGLLPDADALLVAAGSEYEGQFGHRGFSHSLLFALTAATIVFFVARRWGSRPWFTAFLAFLAVGSHGLMDSMTYRTRGIPFLWPFSEDRFQLPWRPIPPAPFGEHFFSRRGVDVMGIEMVYFLPLTLVALAPPLAIWRRWSQRIATWFMKTQAEIRANLEPAALVPVPAPRPAFTARVAVARVLVVGAVFSLSLALAQTTLRDSRPVAWLERAHDQTIAVSLQQTPKYRHLR